MDSQNIDSIGSRPGISNTQFSNMYHWLRNHSQFFPFPVDTTNYRMMHHYQSSPMFSSPEPFISNSLINPHHIFAFPTPVTSSPLVPANVSQWQAPISVTNPGVEEPTVIDGDDISPPGETPTILPPPSIASESMSMIRERENSKRKKKFKKRSIQEQLPKKDWKKEDADLALKTEYEHGNMKRKQQIVIKFSDEELNVDVVKRFHSGIKFVHFQTSCGPRYCFAHVDESFDVDTVIEELNKVKFQNGFLKAERKVLKNEEEVSAEEIDPYTLYLGNLPQNVTSSTVKEKFKKASRIDIGFAQKIKYTRYAFIRFKNVHDAIEAYKENVDDIIDNRSVVLRFRRISNKETNSMKGRKKIKLEEEILEQENNELTGENKKVDKEKVLMDNVREEDDLSSSVFEIKTEINRGYADEIINEDSSTLPPVFGTLFEKKDCDSTSKYLNFVEKTNDLYFSSGNLPKSPNSEVSSLAKFISRVIGVPEISTYDAELFKKIVLRLADIFKNSKSL